jgi:diphthine-ammonia ligase
MLWSGGKDSFVSYLMASSALGFAARDWLFVTFVPPSGVFQCHPLGLLERQSATLGIDHLFVTIDPRDWNASYRESFRCLRAVWRIDRVFSGDILFGSATVEDYWLMSMLDDVGIELTLPLAGMHAGQLFDRIEEYGITAVVSAVAEWADCPQLVGERISLESLHASGIYRNPYFDLAGEQGKYHTTVLAAAGTRFVSPGDAVSSERTRRVGGMDLGAIHASLLELSSPRLDLTQQKA